MDNGTPNIRQRRALFLNVFLIGLVVISGLYYYWPKISNFNILSPEEQEVHGYLREIIPAVRSTLQKFKQLDEDPANATFAADLGRLSDEILTINEKYWKKGSRTESFLRMLINLLPGTNENDQYFLAHWKGPEEEPEPLYDMLINTRTLMDRAWKIKENSNKLAKELKILLAVWKAKGKNSTPDAVTLVDTGWKSLGDVDQVYRRWKGSYRSPFYSFFSYRSKP